MKKPRILLGVTSNMSFRLLEGFPQYLVSAGWDVHLVSSPGDSLTRLGTLDGITSHAIPMEREPSPSKDISALLAWVRLLRAVRPDLISVGTPKAGLLGSVSAFVARVPYRIYMLRGLRLETSTGLKFALLRFTERLSALSSSHVVAVSESLRAKAIEMRLVRGDKISVIGGGSSNGVDVAAFQAENFSTDALRELRLSLGIESRIPVVGFVGRLSRDKGLHVLTQARLALVHAGVAHQLLVIGGEDGGNDGAVGDNSTELTTAYTGHVADPAPYFQLIDVLCLPTLREGFPNVVLEAGAAGIPTVTTTATGAIDSVLDGRTGLIATVGSADSLSEKLTVLLTDPAARLRMGEAAHEFVRENYERSLVWQLTEAFFRLSVPHDFSDPQGMDGETPSE